MSICTIPAIDSATFNYVCRLVNQHTGIVLEPSKGYLVEARLTPIVKRKDLDSIAELIQQLRGEPFGEAHAEVIEAMLIHETSFCRDFHPFDVLKSLVLPQLIAARGATRTLSIWSAACSSGQEADTLAMLLIEHFPVLRDWKVMILATDLSGRVLDRARKGEYTQLEVNRGLPSNWLVNYFQRDGLRWQINPEVRRSVKFMKMNLTADWPVLPTMDLILLRNLLIYFAPETKRAILDKVRRQLASDGTLLLGAAETMLGFVDGWQRVPYGHTSTYRPDGT